MKIPTTLLGRVLIDEGLQTNLATKRDLLEIEDRVEHEGMSFLTITLPSLDDALIQGLTKGFLTPSDFPGFKPWRRGGKLPALMSGFFRNVFEDDGWLKEKPCIASIRAIRQVTRLFKKVELPCSAARIKRAYERYLSNDQGILGNCDSHDDNGRSFDLVCGYLWSDLEELSGELYCSPGVFGSGATAERAAFNERYSIRKWPTRGDDSFPATYHVLASEDDVSTLHGLKFLSEEEEEPVRVVQVPKTLKTPRTISVEPSYMMLRQQSIAKPLMELLEKGYLGFKSIRFTDQTVNKELARVGSVDGSLATIDLSDASDLVSNDLVKRMLKTCPTFLKLLQDSRSTTAIMPDASRVTLKKFASMGSAMCFPVEAMVFYSIVLSSMVRQSGRVPSRNLLERLSANIAVYGDDIIVPADVADGVMADLEAFGLRVNHTKSFTTGFFRESCGGDYYAGEDVTPSYLRHLDDTVDIREPRFVVACVSLSNQFYMKGLWHASQYLRDLVERRLGRIESSTDATGCLTWASVCFNTGLRYDPERSGYTLRGPTLRVQRQDDPILDIRAGLLLAFQSGALVEKLRELRGRRARLRVRRSLSISEYSGEGNAYALRSSPSSDETELAIDCDSANQLVRVDRLETRDVSWLSLDQYGTYRQSIDDSSRRASEGRGTFSHLAACSGVPKDFLTSVTPYAVKMKRRKVSASQAGLNW